MVMQLSADSLFMQHAVQLSQQAPARLHSSAPRVEQTL
jgi:hypothetical protein